VITAGVYGVFTVRAGCNEPGNGREKYLSVERYLIDPDGAAGEFEEILDTRYSGSNFLYIKLPKRKSACRFYQNDKRISSVREEIVRLLSSGQ
jgi:hypothetical protein